MKIRKGDTVKVLYGKDAGKTGKVVRVFTKTGKVVVEGVNVFKRHMKGDRQSRPSEIVEIVKAMPSSKVMVVGIDGKPTRVGYKIVDGKKVRIGKRDGKELGVAVEKKGATKESDQKNKEVKKKKVTKKEVKKSK